MTRTSTPFPQALILASCAVSAGVHAGLVPAHIHEEPALAGAFALAAVGLVAIAVALDRGHTVALVPAGLLFAALLGGYALAVLGGAGPLQRDDPDLLGLATKAVELAGLGGVAFLLVQNNKEERHELTSYTQARNAVDRGRGGHGRHGLGERSRALVDPRP